MGLESDALINSIVERAGCGDFAAAADVFTARAVSWKRRLRSSQSRPQNSRSRRLPHEEAGHATLAAAA